MSGCASIKNENTLGSEIAKIERTHSRVARIEEVSIINSDAGAIIKGRIRNKVPLRGPINGHLDVRVIDSNGVLLTEDTVKYIRLSHKSRVANFLINSMYL